MKHRFTLILPLFMLTLSCGESTENSTENQGETAVEITEVESIDTTTIVMMNMIVMGKETMMQNLYEEGKDYDAAPETFEVGDGFERLINVDKAENSEGFSEQMSGSIKSRNSVVHLTHIENPSEDLPFRASLISKIKDYKMWKLLFDSESKNRTNAGMQLVQLGTMKSDPNTVFVLIALPDIAKARDYMREPSFRAKMEQSGVIGEPEIKFWRTAGPQVEEL